MNVWQAVLLAIVEGLTEFLPVSSTGHLVLVSSWLQITQTNFVKSFEIAIQLGAILAVAPIMISELLRDYRIGLKTAAAFIPTGVAGVLAYDFIKGYLLGNPWVTAGALIAGGVVMVMWKAKKGQAEKLTYLRAIQIGTYQILSMVPGVSRAAATIIGGEMVGLSRPEAVKFSFLLALPTMFAATGLDVIRSKWQFSANEWIVLAVGGIVAFGVAMLAVKWLTGFVKRHDMAGFGWYRIALAIVWLISMT